MSTYLNINAIENNSITSNKLKQDDFVKINGTSILGSEDIVIESYDDTEIKDLIEGKVDKVDGKQLSTEDFTSALKTKLEGLGESSGTVTSVATGVGLTGGPITGSGTIKANLKSEANATRDSNTITNNINRQYAVVPDKSGYLSVNVPWPSQTDATTTMRGLMTASDKIKLDGIEEGATANDGTITGVTAGKGLTGGGDSGAVTLNIGAGSGITVNDDSIEINSAYLGYINNGNAAYGWGNHSTAGYAKTADIPSSLKNPNALTIQKNGTTVTNGTYDGSAAKTVNITVPTKTSDLTNDSGFKTTDTTYTFANGTNGFTVTPSGGSAQTVTVTPSIADATTSNSGLMSSTDKTKLDNIASGATAVTEATVSGWGFTKNTGTYTKPSGGIPKTDLESSVQTALTNLEGYPTSEELNEMGEMAFTGYTWSDDLKNNIVPKLQPYYITSFTVQDLYNLTNTTDGGASFSCTEKAAIEEALSAGRPIYIYVGTSSDGFIGAYHTNAFIEDMLYISFNDTLFEYSLEINNNNNCNAWRYTLVRQDNLKDYAYVDNDYILTTPNGINGFAFDPGITSYYLPEAGGSDDSEILATVDQTYTLMARTATNGVIHEPGYYYVSGNSLNLGNTNDHVFGVYTIIFKPTSSSVVITYPDWYYWANGEPDFASLYDADGYLEISALVTNQYQSGDDIQRLVLLTWAEFK